MPVVLIPTAYRAPTRGRGEVEASGATVLECLRSVGDRYPGFLELVIDGEGAVHPFVKLFVNEAEIERDAVETPLADGDRLEVLAAIAGG
jgi:molybdopterin converting factor small subunit